MVRNPANQLIRGGPRHDPNDKWSRNQPLEMAEK